MNSRRECWPWTNSSYITMIRRQSNNQWSGGIVVQTAPKNSECKNQLEIFSPRFLGSRQHPPQWLSSKRPNSQRGVLSISVAGIERYFKENFTGSSPLRSSSTTMPGLTGHLQPRRHWPTWASNFLITLPILQIWPRRTTTCSMDWKTIEKSAFFFLRGDHCRRGDLVGRTTVWIFFSVACKSYSNRPRSVLSFVWIILNKLRGFSL